MSEAEISEALIDVADDAYSQHYFKFDTGVTRDSMRAALEAVFSHLHPQPAELAFDVEAMLAACVPGGSIVDPQVVADNIRAWVAERKPAELAEQQGDALAALAVQAGAYEYGDPEARYYDFSAEQLAKFAALAATGKQQVGEVQGDAPVTGEMVNAARMAYGTQPVNERGFDRMRDALEAALAARQPGAQDE